MKIQTQLVCAPLRAAVPRPVRRIGDARLKLLLRPFRDSETSAPSELQWEGGTTGRRPLSALLGSVWSLSGKQVRRADTMSSPGDEI